jgi:hypothetical protein
LCQGETKVDLSLFQQRDENSELDFTFDAELAKLTEEKSEPTKNESPKPAMQMVSGGNHSVNSNSAHMASPTSPAADDLGLKIASVKNVWDSLSPMAPVFEQMEHK